MDKQDIEALEIMRARLIEQDDQYSLEFKEGLENLLQLVLRKKYNLDELMRVEDLLSRNDRQDTDNVKIPDQLTLALDEIKASMSPEEGEADV